MTTRMVYLPIDWTAFARWAGSRQLIRRGAFDEGYALHILLSGVFGQRVLQPFRLIRSARARKGTLYAYCDQDERQLIDVARAVGTPDSLDVLGLDDLATKAMPHRFRVGQRLGFDVRIRPIRRLGRDVRDSQSGGVLRKGSEIDAFRHELLRRSPDGWHPNNESAKGISREAVYARWLDERLADVAEVNARSCRLANFRRSRAVRGDNRGPEGPDATMHGEFVVQDPAEFVDRLRRGVGRHRAYGYGMLILRPPGTAPRTS